MEYVLTAAAGVYTVGSGVNAYLKYDTLAKHGNEIDPIQTNCKWMERIKALSLTPVEIEQVMILVDSGVIHVHTFAYIASDENLTKAIRRVILNSSGSNLVVAEARYAVSGTHGGMSTDTYVSRYSPVSHMSQTLRKRTKAAKPN